MSGPLAGLKVLDLSWILSGPFAAMILADLGAEVIKVERPGSGDPARGNGPFIDGLSSYFLSINRGKKSLTLDLKCDQGKKLFLELVKKGDVLVENFTPGTMKGLGLDYPVLAGYNPRLIYVAISGFGQTGPYASRPALDIIVQALGGMMSITGEPGGPPLRPGASLGDIVAGLYAVIGILTAAYERERSGQGQMLDLSMLDCQVAVLENAFTRFLATGEVPRRLGSRHPVFTPFQAFPTQDGHVVVAIVGGVNDQWPLFCATIGHVELIDDPRFRDGWLRTQHYEALEPVLSQAFTEKTTAQWLEEFARVDIPCAPVQGIDQAARDPQIQAREMITQVPHPRLGQLQVVNTPFRFSRTPAKVKEPSPELGEHTRQILTNLLSLSPPEIEALAHSEVI